MEHKIIKISKKHQLTIPQKYFDTLGFDNQAECILQECGIFIRPPKRSIKFVVVSDFSEQILADLIAQGFSGQELLKEFKAQSKKIRPAVAKLIEKADTLAKDDTKKH